MLVVKNPSMQVKEYLRVARASGIQPVSVLDKREVLNYLTGKTSHSDRIDAAASGLKKNNNKKHKRAPDEKGPPGQRKRTVRGDMADGQSATRPGHRGLAEKRRGAEEQQGGAPPRTFAHIIAGEVSFQNRASILNANARSFASVLKIL